MKTTFFHFFIEGSIFVMLYEKFVGFPIHLIKQITIITTLKIFLVKIKIKVLKHRLISYT